MSFFKNFCLEAIFRWYFHVWLIPYGQHIYNEVIRYESYRMANISKMLSRIKRLWNSNITFRSPESELIKMLLRRSKIENGHMKHWFINLHVCYTVWPRIHESGCQNLLMIRPLKIVNGSYPVILPLNTLTGWEKEINLLNNKIKL